MRILIINTSEKMGGPAVAASRLMESLKNNGITPPTNQTEIISDDHPGTVLCCV